MQEPQKGCLAPHSRVRRGSSCSGMAASFIRSGAGSIAGTWGPAVHLNCSPWIIWVFKTWTEGWICVVNTRGNLADLLCGLFPNEVVLRLSFYIFFLMFHYLEAQIFVWNLGQTVCGTFEKISENESCSTEEKNVVFLAYTLSIFYIANDPRQGVLQYVKCESKSCLMISTKSLVPYTW